MRNTDIKTEKGLTVYIKGWKRYCSKCYWTKKLL